MKFYRLISFTFAMIFAIVGLIFLFFPDTPLIFFNNISQYIGMMESPVCGANFYLILAAAYMYVVTLIASMMFKHPGVSAFPLILANGKLASSILSLYLFMNDAPYLIYLTNCVVDGSIGLIALYFYFRVRKSEGSKV
jgi:hypothetical protein